MAGALAAGISVCEENLPPPDMQAPTPKIEDHRAELAVNLLKVEADGADSRHDPLSAADYRNARALPPETQLAHIEFKGGVYSVIHDARTGIVTLVLQRGGSLSAPFCLKADGNPNTDPRADCGK